MNKFLVGGFCKPDFRSNEWMGAETYSQDGGTVREGLEPSFQAKTRF